ncbi:hypothetical protein SASPL_144421 [Salvia splendens]|uniref:Uncharacterized protein n=1 Tax=Salvia splendens TaxID=180675 RepID=A0A8X8WF78_SALSN|nr:hypothetical protein SASPL_144421 [Salvia splendens]
MTTIRTPLSFPAGVTSHRLPHRLPPPLRRCRRLACMFQVFYIVGFSDETIPALLESSYKFFSPLRLSLENKATAVVLDKSSHPLRLPPFVKSRIDELNKSDKQHLL